jgi:pyridoxamine 5'-phosphate oxidase
MGTDLRSLRHEYADRGLAEADLADDPVTMFGRWFEDAVDAGIGEPNAMVVSTVSAEGRPSSRMVLLKGYDEGGFVFFTNYASQKAADLEANPACSLLLPWHDLQRQVRIDGTARQVDRSVSEEYFATRPRESRLGAWASVAPVAQSGVVRTPTRSRRRTTPRSSGSPGETCPCPPTWGGYVVRPETVEFWQGRRGRMHDRLRYRRDGEGWVVERLAP